MGSEFFKFRLEELRLLVRNSFLVEDKNVGDIIGVNLHKSVSCTNERQSEDVPCP